MGGPNESRKVWGVRGVAEMSDATEDPRCRVTAWVLDDCIASRAANWAISSFSSSSYLDMVVLRASSSAAKIDVKVLPLDRTS